MAPALVLLPGMDGTGRLYERLLAELPDGGRVVSYPADEALGYAALEARVRAGLPAEPFVLVAESFWPAGGASVTAWRSWGGDLAGRGRLGDRVAVMGRGPGRQGAPR